MGAYLSGKFDPEKQGFTDSFSQDPVLGDPYGDFEGPNLSSDALALLAGGAPAGVPEGNATAPDSQGEPVSQRHGSGARHPQSDTSAVTEQDQQITGAGNPVPAAGGVAFPTQPGSVDSHPIEGSWQPTVGYQQPWGAQIDQPSGHQVTQPAAQGTSPYWVDSQPELNRRGNRGAVVVVAAVVVMLLAAIGLYSVMDRSPSSPATSTAGSRPSAASSSAQGKAASEARPSIGLSPVDSLAERPMADTLPYSRIGNRSAINYSPDKDWVVLSYDGSGTTTDTNFQVMRDFGASVEEYRRAKSDEGIFDVPEGVCYGGSKQSVALYCVLQFKDGLMEIRGHVEGNETDKQLTLAFVEELRKQYLSG